ncbi:CCT motif [Musa troglodytarum]|uniref:CCT motif n=1 Tax=Musa troglodytarum TaxID=320322 RepID=A0A9E7I0Y3_9LILI|nr:CCT motif [Musa troglodytarum]
MWAEQVLVEVGCGSSSPMKVPEQRACDGDRMAEGSGLSREARVMRYKEKRRNRLFAKRIRYEVRKLNAEKRPRVKGRFVRRKDDDDDEEEDHL